MKRSERQKLYKCNTKDLIKLINDPKYRNNKEKQFSDIVKYIARHEMYKGNTQSELFDLVYTARSELIAQEAKEHKDSPVKLPYDKVGNVSEKGNTRIKDFIRDPINTMRNELRTLATNGLNDDVDDYDIQVYNNRLKHNAVTLYTELNVLKDQGQIRYGNYPERTDILSRLEKKIPDANVGKALDRVSSGIFGRLFRRPSKEYKAFETALNEYREYGKAYSGNTEDLEKKTTAYLKHVIPEYDPKDIENKKEEWLNCLPKDKRRRAELALNVIESVNEHKEMKPYMDNVEKGMNGKKIDPSVDQDKPEKQNLDNQQEFQNNLIIDVEEKILGNPIINNYIEKEEVSNDIDEEKLDASVDQKEL